MLRPVAGVSFAVDGGGGFQECLDLGGRNAGFLKD